MKIGLSKMLVFGLASPLHSEVILRVHCKRDVPFWLLPSAPYAFLFAEIAY